MVECSASTSDVSVCIDSGGHFSTLLVLFLPGVEYFSPEFGLFTTVGQLGQWGWGRWCVVVLPVFNS